MTLTTATIIEKSAQFLGRLRGDPSFQENKGDEAPLRCRRQNRSTCSDAYADIDDQLASYESTQQFQLVEAAAFFWAGPCMDIIERGVGLFTDKKCVPFYTGRVAPS